MAIVFLIMGELVGWIVCMIDSIFGLEFQFEFEFVRSTFTTSLFRLFYLSVPSIQYGFVVIIIKLCFKIIMYYVYPTHYESIRNGLNRCMRHCFHKENIEFTEMERCLFTKKLGIAQYTDTLSLTVFFAVVSIFFFRVKRQNDFTKLSDNEMISISGLCAIELTLEMFLTLFLIRSLAKNLRFMGLSLHTTLAELN